MQGYKRIAAPKGVLGPDGLALSHVFVPLSDAGGFVLLGHSDFQNLLLKVEGKEITPHAMVLTEQLFTGDYFRVDAFFEKMLLPPGVVDQHESPLSWVLVPVNLGREHYRVILKEYTAGLYEIDQTRYYVRFRSFAGHRRYSGEHGVLSVGANARQSRFYLQPW